MASPVRPKKPGPSWGPFWIAGNLMQGFTCNWNILAMNCQIWLTLTLSDPLFLILMTPHLALDLKIGPPVRLLELLLAEKFCALTGPRLEPFKKLGIRMVGFLLCYIKHNDQALFRTYEKGHSFSVIFYQPFCISTGHLCHSPIEKQLPYPTYLKGVGSTFAM